MLLSEKIIYKDIKIIGMNRNFYNIINYFTFVSPIFYVIPFGRMNAGAANFNGFKAVIAITGLLRNQGVIKGIARNLLHSVGPLQNDKVFK